jgi:hypothetical protein
MYRLRQSSRPALTRIWLQPIPDYRFMQSLSGPIADEYVGLPSMRHTTIRDNGIDMRPLPAAPTALSSQLVCI